MNTHWQVKHDCEEDGHRWKYLGEGLSECTRCGAVKDE